ncbi:leucyl aminopeptidase [Sphingopyxis bauzanensis]|uniref:Probable cytosol aminopeptidase n=1 Tax=Sphingopyxis bauzanensis TaxID=651663 RepID=A0A246JQ38_9SPHN|nr:leucyl aminopeptidase [Sphingopyxis bauzanensis]OWQ94950.1 leucyl aminopeptidase [Sphingopyxis bauzanensis]GGJ54771.1 putative cytosol aminopeptidase [Sphingopyxis bauzanensis]
MNHKSLLLAACLSLTFAPPAFAQTVTGSGVVPATAANSAERAIGFAANAPASGALVIVMTDATLPLLDGVAFSAPERQAVAAAIAAATFDGKAGSTLSLRGIGAHSRILLVGTGATPTSLALAEAGGKAAQELKSEAQPVVIAGAFGDTSAADVAYGFALGQYRFDRYKTVDKKAPPTGAVTLVGADPAAAEAAFTSRWKPLADGVRLSRDLANEPANVIYPESFVAEVRKAFTGVAGVSIEVLDEAAMRRLNMGNIVGVGQGSPRGSRMMLVRYRGSGAPAAPLALVGKGITFDTGGISIKPSANMGNMKGDMSGAASVMGAALSLAKSRAPVHVVAVAALAENMPDGNAMRPADVIRTMSGKTVEIVSTDAEGRLVLADANEYVAQAYKPRAIVNIATLTGAIVGALSDQYAGLFSRDEALAAKLLAAGTASGEELWRMPLHKNFFDRLKSDVADIRNGGSDGPGASTGAHFIGFFVDDAMPWAHLDIAGVNRSEKTNPLTPKGMTGFGVRLLDQLARSGE